MGNIGESELNVNSETRNSELIPAIKGPIDAALERGLPDHTWEMADAAKWYAGMGWKVFPVNRADKRPLVKDWPNAAMADPDQIAAWWREHPTAMIAVVCGSRSGISAVDADGQDGIDVLEALEQSNGRLGNLATSYTPGGGLHLFYRAESLPFEKTESRIAAKIDVRSSKSDGSSSGYLIVPPSRRVDGKRYEWHETSIEQLLNLTEAPDWLALRACFDAEERKAIEADQTLKSLILTQPRKDWRAAFDMRREGERRLRNLEALDEIKDRKGGEYSLNHPYIQGVIEGELKTLASCQIAQNAQLNESAFNVGTALAGAGLAGPQDVGTNHITVRKVSDQLFEAAMSLPVMDPSRPWTNRAGREGARKTIESGLGSGLLKPRELPKREEQRGRQQQRQEPPKGKLSVVRMDQVPREQIEFLWEPFIAYGKITGLAGDPGLGKSQVTIDLAARVTTGAELPNLSIGQAPKRKPASVVLISGEDDPGDTIRPRLEAAGADLSRVHLIKGRTIKLEDGTETIEVLSLQNTIGELDALLTDWTDVKLIVVDPIGAYTGRADTHKDGEVRSILTPLAALAAKHKCAVLIVMHLNKSSDKAGGNPLHRVMGSLGFTAAARSVALITRDRTDPEDTSKRLLLSAKNNLAKDSGGLEFRIKTVHLDNLIETSRVEWGRTTNVTAIEALGQSDDTEGRSAVDEADEWLRLQLSAGPVKADDLMKLAKSEDVSKASIRRAQKRIGIKPEQRGGCWEWALPDDEPSPKPETPG